MAPLFRRRHRAVRTVPGLDLEPGERVLTGTVTPRGVLAVTNRRLVLPTEDGPLALGWDTIERASWDESAEVLEVVESAPVDQRPRRHWISIDRPENVLDVIREQVNASVVLSRHVPVAGDRGVRITGRRSGSDRLSWVVTPDSGLDLEDPEIRARVDAAVTTVRREIE